MKPYRAETLHASTVSFFFASNIQSPVYSTHLGVLVRAGQEGSAGGGKLDRALCAEQELHREFVFKVQDGLPDGGLKR